MKMAARRCLFFAAAIPLFAIYLHATSALKPIGQVVSPYGLLINAHSVPERHVTDAVSAINFDYRAIDTLGEEFILFASVLGAVVLLRQEDPKRTSHVTDMKEGRKVPSPSDAVKLWSMGLMGFTVLFGIYIVTHGQLSPGGGFQGGVILATAPLMLYFSKDFDQFESVCSHEMAELAEALAACGFILIGLGAMALGENFLQNGLPLGKVGSVFSGGTVPLISLATGLEVAGGFVLLLTAFLQYAFAGDSRGDS